MNESCSNNDLRSPVPVCLLESMFSVEQACFSAFTQSLEWTCLVSWAVGFMLSGWETNRVAGPILWKRERGAKANHHEHLAIVLSTF